jgi:hypothetical protein
MPSAIRPVCDPLQESPQESGLGYADAVRKVVHATHLESCILHEELRKAANAKNLPAATRVQVRRLYVSSLVVEAEFAAIDRKSIRCSSCNDGATSDWPLGRPAAARCCATNREAEFRRVPRNLPQSTLRLTQPDMPRTYLKIA